MLSLRQEQISGNLRLGSLFNLQGTMLSSITRVTALVQPWLTRSATNAVRESLELRFVNPALLLDIFASLNLDYLLVKNLSRENLYVLGPTISIFYMIVIIFYTYFSYFQVHEEHFIYKGETEELGKFQSDARELLKGRGRSARIGRYIVRNQRKSNVVFDLKRDRVATCGFYVCSNMSIGKGDEIFHS